MNKFVLRQSLLLLLTATIWGVAFVAQSVGMDYVGPFTFNAVRCLIGGVVLLPCIAILNKFNRKNGVECMEGETGKEVGIFLRKKVGAKIWCGVGIAVVGLYLLCMTESGFSIQKGDLLLMLCALVFSMHILVIDYFSPKVDGVKMSCIQFFTCGILSGVGMLLTEHPQMSDILAAWMPILYAGVMSCGVAYTLQIVGQKGMNPTVASLILSMESVISVIAGWLILHQTLSTKELMGCVLMFAAIILVQLPDRVKK